MSQLQFNSSGGKAIAYFTNQNADVWYLKAAAHRPPRPIEAAYLFQGHTKLQAEKKL
jgi:hypothetical protein